MNANDELTLTRELLRIDTVNPPGNEQDCARRIGALLQQWGYQVRFHDFAPGRTNVIASLGGVEARPPLCLTGHIDTVPVGAAAWTHDPFAGETDGDRLYGRGSTDMKAGVAGMLIAARNLAQHLPGTAGIRLVLTAAEEGGCVGSRHLAEMPGLLGHVGALVVGEPTSNYPHVGHKGSVKFWAKFRGVAAHGSMPELGVNAIYKAAAAIERLAAFDFAIRPHPVMGAPTLNVSIMHAGNTINSVPDEAVIGVDVRSVAGLDHAEVMQRLRTLLGDDVELEVFQDAPAVWTEPETEWVQRVFGICARTLGEQPEPRTMSYNTDAGNLLKVYRGAPTVVLGPGDAAMAHQRDEYCRISKIRESVAIYEAIIRDWCTI
jgi:succinyl-diaminopimelate desuccinylase